MFAGSCIVLQCMDVLFGGMHGVPCAVGALVKRSDTVTVDLGSSSSPSCGSHGSRFAMPIILASIG
jgi:hypothetical protein